MKTQNQSVQPTIVSIQSQLVYGCAGNNAAVPLLQMLGATVYAVPTVVMSNTPHYPTFSGIDMPPNVIDELLSSFLERVSAKQLTAILTGYIRDVAIVAIVANFIDRVRTENPAIIVLADPVMGDTDLGLFIPEETAQGMKNELVARADICTPNLFEARYITGKIDVQPQNLQTAMLDTGARISVITGLGLEQDACEIQTVADQNGQRWSTSTSRLPIRPTGTGDLLAAAFLFHWLITRDVSTALQKSVANVYSIMQQAADMNLQELEPSRL